ncbi:MAG: adenylosuccinate synthetase [Patescibacteria group bacterium]
MSKKLFIVTDLGGGDGGKGGVIHKLCSLEQVHTVIKVGGAQGSHGVRTANGEAFCFSQFGCGTFNGSRTHISKLMVIDPLALGYEAELLKYNHGVRNIFDLLSVDSRALCVTPFHQIASRLRELARKDKPKGTVGVGVGEAVSDAERFPDLAFRAGDLGQPNILNRLEAVRKQKLTDLAEIIAQVEELWPEDKETARELIQDLQNPNFPNVIQESWARLATQIQVVPPDYLGRVILARAGTVVVESSHGVLTDRFYGFHPHTTKLRTLPEFTLAMLSESGYDGEMVKLGVTRGYQIRHGAGPMVTESPELLEKLLPGSSKEANRWQGEARVGPLDLVSLRYAINACGGTQTFDGLAITWFDQIGVFGEWPVCQSYIGADDQNFFSPEGERRVHCGSGFAQLEYQKKLGERLKQCRPRVSCYPFPDPTDKESLATVCQEVCRAELKLPVKMISFGPTEDDKVCL